jgi:UDP-glucuronate 4-epimerase
MRALVTGCAGFIGSHLTESLLGDGHDVLGVDCFSDNYERPQKLANLRTALDFDSFRFARSDLADADASRLLDDCEVVFHLAAEPGVRSSWGARFDVYLRNNVAATQRLLEAALTRRDLRFVYASSSSVYGDAETLPTPEDTLPRPLSPYGVTKLAAEQLCLLYHVNHGLQAVALRYFSVYGPRQRPDMAFNRFCRAALADEPVTIFGDGRQTRDFTYVADVVAATRAAAVTGSAPGRVYNVGGGSRVSVRQALEALSTVSGSRLDVRFEPREHGDAANTGADITRARRDLGFAPSTSLEAGLLAEYEWLAEQERRAPGRRELSRAGAASGEAEAAAFDRRAAAVASAPWPAPAPRSVPPRGTAGAPPPRDRG